MLTLLSMCYLPDTNSLLKHIEIYQTVLDWLLDICINSNYFTKRTYLKHNTNSEKDVRIFMILFDIKNEHIWQLYIPVWDTFFMKRWQYIHTYLKLSILRIKKNIQSPFDFFFFYIIIFRQLQWLKYLA